MALYKETTKLTEKTNIRKAVPACLELHWNALKLTQVTGNNTG